MKESVGTRERIYRMSKELAPIFAKKALEFLEGGKFGEFEQICDEAYAFYARQLAKASRVFVEQMEKELGSINCKD